MACDEISFFSSWSWHGIIVGLFQSGAPNWRRERKSRPILSRAYLWDKMNGYALVVRLGMMCDIHITSNCSSGQYRSVAEVTFMWWWCGNFVYLFVLYSFRFFFFSFFFSSTSGCNYRRSRPFGRSARIGCCQEPVAGWQNRCYPLWGIDPLRSLLQVCHLLILYADKNIIWPTNI